MPKQANEGGTPRGGVARASQDPDADAARWYGDVLSLRLDGAAQTGDPCRTPHPVMLKLCDLAEALIQRLASDPARRGRASPPGWLAIGVLASVPVLPLHRISAVEQKLAAIIERLFDSGDGPIAPEDEPLDRSDYGTIYVVPRSGKRVASLRREVQHRLNELRKIVAVEPKEKDRDRGASGHPDPDQFDLRAERLGPRPDPGAEAWAAEIERQFDAFSSVYPASAKGLSDRLSLLAEARRPPSEERTLGLRDAARRISKRLHVRLEATQLRRYFDDPNLAIGELIEGLPRFSELECDTFEPPSRPPGRPKKNAP